MDISEQIYAKLCERLGRDAVYKDIYTIPKGVRDDEHSNQHIPNAPVFLELIGPTWVSGTDQQGSQRLHQREDTLRSEINMALRFRISTIPVFIDTPPLALDAVPTDIRPLLMHNGVAIHTATLDAGLATLIAAIELYMREDKYRYCEHDGTRALATTCPHPQRHLRHGQRRQ